jgi:hypothetical protein
MEEPVLCGRIFLLDYRYPSLSIYSPRCMYIQLEKQRTATSFSLTNTTNSEKNTKTGVSSSRSLDLVNGKGVTIIQTRVQGTER